MNKVPSTIRVSVYHLAILLNNIWVASRHPNLGIVDANRTLDSLVQDIDNKDVTVNTEVLESCLYYANLLNEEDNFYHPKEVSFDTLLLRSLPSGIKFDKNLNLLYLREGKHD